MCLRAAQLNLLKWRRSRYFALLQVHDFLQEQRSALDCSAQFNDISAALAELSQRHDTILEHVRSRRSAPRIVCSTAVQCAKSPSRAEPVTPKPPPQRATAATQVTPCDHSLCKRSPSVQPRCEETLRSPAAAHAPAVCSVPVLRVGGSIARSLPCCSVSDRPCGPTPHRPARRPSSRGRSSGRYKHAYGQQHCRPGVARRPQSQMPSDNGPSQAYLNRRAHACTPGRLRTDLRGAVPCGSASKLSRGRRSSSVGREPVGACQTRVRPPPPSWAPSKARPVAPANCSHSPTAGGGQKGGRRATARSRAALMSAAEERLWAPSLVGVSPRCMPPPCGRNPAQHADKDQSVADEHAYAGSHAARRCSASAVQQRGKPRVVAEATRASRRIQEKLTVSHRAQHGRPSKPAKSCVRSLSTALRKTDAAGSTPGKERGEGFGDDLKRGAAQALPADVKSISPLSLAVPRKKRGRAAAAECGGVAEVRSGVTARL